MTELGSLLTGRGTHAALTSVLEAIDEASLAARPHGAPHSIYEEVWHMAFWQDLLLDWIEGKDTPVPTHAAGSWPERQGPGDEREARAVVQGFLAGVDRAVAVTADADRLDLVVRRSRTVRDLLENLAAHNAYHAGRIVLLRQLLGAWPPPSGGDTW
jgi:uncharacterized damage-inducible protein DinB